MEVLVLGTKEQLVVKVDDRKGQLTDLSALTPQYDILRASDDTVMITGASAVPDGLKAYCLVDTTQVSPAYTAGIYNLFLKFTSAPEAPVRGPFPFKVEDK